MKREWGKLLHFWWCCCLSDTRFTADHLRREAFKGGSMVFKGEHDGDGDMSFVLLFVNQRKYVGLLGCCVVHMVEVWWRRDEGMVLWIWCGGFTGGVRYWWWGTEIEVEVCVVRIVTDEQGGSLVILYCLCKMVVWCCGGKEMNFFFRKVGVFFFRKMKIKRVLTKKWESWEVYRWLTKKRVYIVWSCEYTWERGTWLINPPHN